MKKIKNVDTEQHTWVGQIFTAGYEHEIPVTELLSWSTDDTLLSAIASGLANVYDGATAIVGVNNQIEFLKDMQISVVTVSSTPAFGSKTILVGGVTKKLYARNIGFQSTLVAGENIVTYTLALPWVKLLGVEVINCEALDFVDLKVLDSTSGTYFGTPNLVLNQFAFATNIPKDYYLRMANFDADLYTGMQIQITYNSVSAKTVGFNLITNEVKA